MEINGSNVGASTYAMKKAIEVPNLMLNLVQQSGNNDSQSLNTRTSVFEQPPDLSVTDKGKIIDIVA